MMIDAAALQTLGFHAERAMSSTELLSCPDERDNYRTDALRSVLAAYVSEGIQVRSNEDKKTISAEEVVRQVRPLLLGKQSEELIVYAMKGDEGEAVKVAVGTTDEVRFPRKQIAKVLLERDATGVIFIHNHPNGNAKHSRSDIETVEAMRSVLEPLHITVVDSIVVTDTEYSSLKYLNKQAV